MGHSEYLANTLPIISSSIELLFFFFLRGLAKTLSLPRVPMSYRYGKGIVQLKGPVIYYQYTFTNIVPNSEPIESNSSFL